ncbi:MAG: hypothetical protein EA397_05800 [Deltaproteobacteria bacterium]|nr:MAG: hypothetical protein EA397_05800 [Deltaproteobacteria bacterium]
MASSSENNTLANLRQQFDSLPARSKYMLMFLLVLIAVTWMGGLWWWTSSTLSAQAGQLTSQQNNLLMYQNKQLEYIQATQLITQAEERLAQLGRQNPSSYIEQRVTQHDVRDALRGIERMGTEKQGNIQETRYRVSLERAPLAPTTEFLFDIENSGFLGTESVTIRTNFVQGERLLSVTLDLIAYDLVRED